MRSPHSIGAAKHDPAEHVAVLPGSSPLKRTGFVLFTLLLVLGGPVVGLEMILRVLDRPSPVVSGWRGPTGDRYRFQHNQLGFRGQPIEYSDEDYVIVLVGDSQVEATACSYYWMPERRLERHLSAHRQVRVFSLAASGYGQDQQLLALREYLKRFRADKVIVWQTPGNDIWNNTFPTMDPQGRRPKPTYRLENGVLRGPTAEIAQVVSSRFRLIALYQRSVHSWDHEWERYLPAAYTPLTDYEGPVSHRWQMFFDRNLGTMPTDDMATEKSHQTIYLTPRSPRTQYGIDLTHRLLQEMRREARAHGASFMTFWVESQSEEVAPNEEAVFVLNGRYYRAAYEQRSLTMAAVNAGFDTYIAPVPAGDRRVSPTDGHLNEHAVDAVMADLAKAVAQRLAPGS